MRKLVSIFLPLISVIFVGLDSVSSQDLPRRMASLGDSITEGVLADYSYENRMRTGEIFGLLRFLQIDDIHKRIEAFRKAFAAYDKSWAIGNSQTSFVRSHFRRIQSRVPELVAENFAVAGSTSHALDSQVTRLLQRQEEGGGLFDYVTILIGSNDFGVKTVEDITHPERFKANLKQAASRLLEHNPELELLIVGLPNVLDIFEATKSLVVEDILGNVVNCDDTRKLIYGKYPVFEGRSGSHVGMIEALMQDYVLASQELVSELKQSYPYAFIKYTGIIHSRLNPRKVISTDCFHPSEWGQAELAEISWRQGFWPDL